MNKVTIIGHFAYGLKYLDGQTIKTKIVSKELKRRLGAQQVREIDTHGGINTLFKAPFHIFLALRDSKNVIILPAHNGLRIYAPLLALATKIFRNRKLHYVVIGGWLPEFLKQYIFTRKSLHAFQAIYVETNTMKRALEKEGYSNVCVMPNCKDLEILSEKDLDYHVSEPYKLCTFSRVMKEKGIEDAINVVRNINEKAGKNVYELDIYGPVDPKQIEWFEVLKKNFPAYVHYKGMVSGDKSVDALKNYFLLLFPTRFYTEGIPGTIIDAYAAGVPVLSSKWESFNDIVKEGVTGYGFTFKALEEFEELLYKIVQNPQVVISLKKACLSLANEYVPGKALDELILQLY